MKNYFFTLVFAFAFLVLHAQKTQSLIIKIDPITGDTIYIKHLNELEVLPKFKNARQSRRYDRLTLNVKKVYPYAQIAKAKMQEYEQILQNTPNSVAQRKIMKQIEDEIYAQWGDKLKDLTYSQGGILLKLIDRETGESSYELVQEFRGKLRAFFYQSFARVFGFNLKERYDPKGKDHQIEYIVRLIETNRL
jgi:hypothetical protein